MLAVDSAFATIVAIQTKTHASFLTPFILLLLVDFEYAIIGVE
jgi:hypothetical protein